jgi:ABC-type multidrug transport system fused ATPase/permease subunit
LGYILNDAYHLGAALEEIYRIYQMPIEDNKGKLLPESLPQNLVFDNVIYTDNRGRKTTLNFTFKAGHKILISCGNYKIQQYMLHAIVRHLDIKSGRILLGNTDIRDMESRVLRDTIIILDKPVIFEATIKEYLTLGNDDITSSDMYSVLELLELHSIIDDLENKMDTQLSSIGLPLSPTQTLRLKFAAALLLKPKVIVINQFYDSLSAAMKQRILQRLRGLEDITIIYFSNNHHIDGFDEKLFIATEVK